MKQARDLQRQSDDLHKKHQKAFRIYANFLLQRYRRVYQMMRKSGRMDVEAFSTMRKASEGHQYSMSLIRYVFKRRHRK